MEETIEWNGMQIPKQAGELIQKQIDAAKQAGQFAAYDQVKADLKGKAPELFADIDVAKTKLNEMMSVFGDRINKLNESVDPEKRKQEKETPEMARARLEAEYQAKTAEAVRGLKINAALNEVKAAAIAAKLDPEYADAFESLLSKHYPADMNGETVIFRNGDLPLFSGEQPAKPADVAAILLKKYPKLVSSPTPGPSLNGGQRPAVDASKLVNAQSKISAGISEVFTK
jgi:hypothetical protein